MKLTSLTVNQLPMILKKIIDSKDGSEKQQEALNQLIHLLPQLNLYSNQNRQFNPEDFDEAENLMRMAICGIDRRHQSLNGKNIRHFVKYLEGKKLELETIELSLLIALFTKRCNQILKYKLVDLYRQRGSVLSLDVQLDNQKETFVDFVPDVRLSGIEHLISQEDAGLVKRLVCYLEEDPEGVLKGCYPKGYPQCNAQVLVRERLLKNPVQKWRNLAQMLQVPYGTMTAHWNRKCLPLLKAVGEGLNTDCTC